MYFGTDGIRGPANGPILRPDLIVRMAQAAGQVMHTARGGYYPSSVIIGKDTRLSGYMIESALEAGFLSVGLQVLWVGVLPTPAVAHLTRTMRADIGCMITASHNPYFDNGIKFFGPDGIKATQEQVKIIEHLIDNPSEITLAAPEKIGRAMRIEDAVGRYTEFVKTTLPRAFSLEGLKVVLDAANGAAYKIAPRILWELGAEVIRVGSDPDGLNINRECGATHTEALKKAVKAHKAHIGLALDGDADRLIVVDEQGEDVDGDYILAALTADALAQGTLKGEGVVSTVMANMGFEEWLKGQGLTLHRTPVGDHYVETALRECGMNLGGEPSGHLIMKDHATTGDGLLAAVQLLAHLQRSASVPSALRQRYTSWPQKLKNIKLPATANAAEVLAHPTVQKTLEESEKSLTNQGRILVRKSGTEPLIRVMVEAKTAKLVEAHTAKISESIQGVI